MQQAKTADSIPQFLSGGGEMGERIRNYDWASTPIGPIETLKALTQLGKSLTDCKLFRTNG